MGTDITPVQPYNVPPNVSFLIDDCERPWEEEKVDVVHFRCMFLILKNVSGVLKSAFG